MIKFSYNIYFGVKDAFSHKLRAALSILGVVFGVAAVIAMVSISEGAKRDVMKQIRLLGVNNMSVVSKPQGENGDKKRIADLQYRDFQAVSSLGFVRSASPVSQTMAGVYYKDKEMHTEVFGVNDEYADILALPMETGRFILEEDVRKIKNVCVIGSAVKSSLFGINKAVGELIKVGNKWYKVVGVISERQKVESPGAISFKNIDGAVMAPISSVFDTYLTLFEKPVGEIALAIADGYSKEAAIKEITGLLNKAAPDKGFDIIIPSELIAQSYETQRTFNIVLGVIAAISLIIGGIGIMNIMLANVTERTREIGIRRAIGARKSDIVKQFIIESLLLTSIGGLAGVILGIAAASFINYKIGWTVYISLTGVIFSILTASLTGMVFGIYPAVKASALNPIEALRYD